MSNERIHRVLDGELSPRELTPRERLELLRYTSSIGEVVGARASAAPPDLTAAVMARLSALEAEEADGRAAVGPDRRRPLRRRFASWLWQPRAVTLHVRPALAFASVLALALVGSLRWSEPAAAPAEVSAARVFVQFRLDLPAAQRVELAGDFTGWQPRYTLHETEPGVWSVTVPLPPGVHDYAFVVDGERWLPDPLAARVDDGFGGSNSRVAVLLPETPRSS
jgi:hypothetical protein